MTLKLSPFAELDLISSIDYYNTQKPGLGDEFARNINSVFERIKNTPQHFPKEYKNMRKAKVNKFPFNIFFVEQENIAYIIGIFHASREPKILKERYKEK